MSIEQDYREWIKHDQVKRHIVVNLINHDGSVLGDPSVNTMNVAIRNMNVKSSVHLKANIEAFHLDHRAVNWYRSLAHLSGMPVFSFNIAERKKESKLFNKYFKEFMTGYDLVIDLDAKHTSSRIAIKEMQIVHDAFRDMRIPHTVLCSGSGFHITVKSDDIWTEDHHPFIPEIAPLLCRKLVEHMVESWELESVDLDIYDERRIIKIPFTMDIKTGRIARPLEEYDIRKFGYHLCSPHYVLNTPRVWRAKGFGGEERSLSKWLSLVR